MIDKTEASATPVSTRRKRNRRPEGWRSIASTILILLTAPLFALFLMIFVFQSYQVDGPSMEQTLQENDRLIVWKMPRTWARITGNPYIPERGDVIIFVEPSLENYGQSAKKQLIKRVIALPGERVEIEDGIVTVYNDQNPAGFQPDNALLGPDAENTPGTIDLVVPDDHVFVLGDNRSNSLDSRSFGPINANDIVGKLSFRVFPFSKAKHF